ncbi:sensor histidine kinase [Actinomadura verrucosospora]|uniref:sensor histidine kinase n=1 Tax=Actinomadura verrucosospora TaxID=46165 RepID=UPI001FEC8689|nr:HAMP domain-containing sensor histidine kinase [Actinomadura verrucosospora]
MAATLIFTVLAIGADVIVRSRESDFAFTRTEVATRRVSAAVRQGEVQNPLPEGPYGVRLLQVVDADRHVVTASRDAAGRPPISTVVPPPENRLKRLYACPAHGGGCLTVVAVRASVAPDSPVVYGARPVPPMLAGPYIELILAVCALFLVAVTTWAAWQIVGRTLRPVGEVRGRLAEIGITDLSRRVPEPSGEDEVAQLARTANVTLDRLERSVRLQQQFASDAAHELRTPIAALRLNLEEIALHPDDAEVGPAARAAIRAADRLESIVADLLLLAQIGTAAETPEDLDFTGLVSGELRVRGPAPGGPDGRPPIAVNADLAPGLHCRGVRAQLERLVDNLLDNALHYAATTVDVHLESRSGDAVLTIGNDGPQIPRADRERVFERFARLDTARSRDAGGTGLGLAIAREIANAHRGSIAVDDGAPGTRFILRLPLVTEPTAARRNPDG